MIETTMFQTIPSTIKKGWNILENGFTKRSYETNILVSLQNTQLFLSDLLDYRAL